MTGLGTWLNYYFITILSTYYKEPEYQIQNMAVVPNQRVSVVSVNQMDQNPGGFPQVNNFTPQNNYPNNQIQLDNPPPAMIAEGIPIQDPSTSNQNYHIYGVNQQVNVANSPNRAGIHNRTDVSKSISKKDSREMEDSEAI
uniref:Uncharacterized protein n=1 Tax=Euplotes crassus TaxID=5936 RepID=A0A7S3KXX7_EUPCR|mmetsp:Transcript_8720/g.8262  ORF Transcript_8720/g.8262 Transcript_8720/m.8262 type:complete len:141 (+) Transcript_8720:341-763(+)